MELSGSTEIVSLFDLAQVLSVNGATGMLRVQSGQEKGYLYFEDGTIINALDVDHQEGEDAAKRVFSLREADFSFAPDLPSVAHRISCSTQNLMMEIARQLDEESEGNAGQSHGERVREVQQATAELNAIFTRLDSESNVLAHRSHQGFGVLDLLGAIKDSSDSKLFLRRGAPPEVQAGGRMIPLSETRLDQRSYDELRDHLLREARGRLDPVGPDAGELILSLEENGRFRLEIFRTERSELLTIHRLPDLDELMDTLRWPGETLDELIERPGSIVLVTGTTARRVETAFESLCHHLLSTGSGPFVGLAQRWNPELSNGRAGTVLLPLVDSKEPDRVASWIARLDPAIVALEDADRRAALVQVLQGMNRGARALIGVCSESVAHAPLRVVDALDSRERAVLLRHLGLRLAGVLSADGPAMGRVWTVDDAARAAILTGDLVPLTKLLAGPESD